MPDFKCPFCLNVMECDDSWIGRNAECPSCKNEITISISAGDSLSTDHETLHVPVSTTQPEPAIEAEIVESESVILPATETKVCPICGEDILKIAKKCKHCNEWLEPSAKPAEGKQRFSEATTSNGVVRRGEALFISGTWGAFLGLGGSSFGMVYTDSELITFTGPPKTGYWIAVAIWILLWPVALILLILGLLQLSKTKDIWAALQRKDIETIRNIKRNSFNSKFTWPRQSLLNVQYNSSSRKLSAKVRRPDTQRLGNIAVVVDHSVSENANIFAKRCQN